MYESDRALVARMLAGERRAFDEFFAANMPRLVAHAARRSALDAAAIEDVVQSTLIKGLRSLGQYRGDASLYTWLAKICRNELADLHRAAARRPTVVSLYKVEGLPREFSRIRAPEHAEPPQALHADQHSVSLMRVMAALPEQYARALEAKYGDGLSVKDIAKMLNLSRIATQSLLARAREAFRQQWQASGCEAYSQESTP